MKVKRGAPMIERAMAKILAAGECWEWTGTLDAYGYGQITKGGRGTGLAQAHRVIYEALVGPIPTGLVLDHLCRNRRCVRPLHLEPVTLAENKRRGFSPAEINRRKTHCAQGHPYSDENTEWRHYGGSGQRYCKTCRRNRSAKWRQANDPNRKEAS